jgi:hypothetical protein
METRRLKRPRDPIQLDKLIVDIATGQVAGSINSPALSKSPNRPLATLPGRSARRVNLKLPQRSFSQGWGLCGTAPAALIEGGVKTILDTHSPKLFITIFSYPILY